MDETGTAAVSTLPYKRQTPTVINGTTTDDRRPTTDDRTTTRRADERNPKPETRNPKPWETTEQETRKTQQKKTHTNSQTLQKRKTRPRKSFPAAMLGPDEFEGTVERSQDALHLTTLEDLLDTPPKFTKLDLSKESDELYMSVFKVKEALKKWDEVSLANLRLAWDEQAIKISELKDEVAGRKKNLAAKIRHFSTHHLADGDGDDGDNAVVADGKDLVASFKAEFDFVNTSSRFAETAFLSTYKILRDIPDPVEEAEACLTICIRAQEALKSAQDQLNAAAAALEQQGTTAAPSAATATISVFSSSSATAASNAEDAAAAKYDTRVQVPAHPSHPCPSHPPV